MAKAFDLDKWSAIYAANPLNPDRGLNSSYWEINPNDTMTTDEAMTQQAAKEQQAQEPNSIVGLLGNNGNTDADYGYDPEGGDDFITFNKNRPGIKSLLGGIGMLAAAPIAGGAAAAGLAAGTSIMDDPGDFSRKVFNSIPDHSDIEHSALAEAFQTSDDITAEKIRIANVLGLNPDYVTTANREDYQSFARAAEQIEKLSVLKKYQKPDGGIDFDRLYSEIPGLAEVQRTKGNAAAALLLANPEVTKSIKDVYSGSFGRLMGSIAAGWNRGTAQRAINLIYADMEREGRREPTAAEAKSLKDLTEWLKAQPKNSYSGYADTLGGVLGAAVENLPMMGASQIAGGLGAAGVYAATKNPKWAKWVYNIAATGEMAYEISGNQYQENAQAVNANGEYKYTTGQAASLSAAQGLAEAVLEQWTIRDMLGAVFGRSKSVGDLVSIYKQHGFTEEGKALAKATAKEKIMEYAKVSGVSMGSELREEFLQSVADNAIENVWQAGINGRNGEYTSFNDMLAEGVGAAIEAVPAVVGFGIAGGSMHGAANAKKILGFRDNVESNIRENVARHSAITAQYNELISNMQLAVKDSKKIPEEVLTAALDAENEKWGMADAEVDISSLAKEEGGAEIVSILCQAAGIPEETKQRLLTMQTPATVKTSVLMQMGALSPEQQEKLNNHTAPVNGYTPAMLANERQAMQLKIEAVRKAGADKVNNAVERIMNHEAMTGLTDSQKELTREVVTSGFGNPLKMVDLRQKEARKTIRTILRPIIDGLKAEGGQGTVVIPKEGGDLSLEGGIRVSENAPWYQQFYKDNGRAPSAYDLQEIATAYVIPEVDSRYLLDEIVRLSPDQYDAAEADALRKALAEQKDLEEIKTRLEKIDPGTLTMSDILSEDGQKVFNYFLKAHGNGNKDVQRAASVDALLGALMYQRLKEYYSKLGREYSAEDFILRTQVEAGGALISAEDIQVQKDGDLVVKGLKVHPDFVEGNRITGNVKGLLDKIAGILDSDEPQNAMALRSFIPADIADGFLNAMQENDVERAKKIISDKAAAMDEVYNQITVPLNLDEQVEILDFDKIEDLAMNNRELIEYLKRLPKQEIMSADLRAIVGLPENSDKIGQKHLVFNKSTYKDKNRVATRKTLNSFSDVIANARLVEVEPNTKVRDYSGMNPNQRKKQTRKNSVPSYYRFFVPIRLNGETYTLVISAEETAAQNGKAAKTRAYEIFTVKNGKKRLPAPQRFDRNTPSDSVSGAGNTISIRETLANVKDRNGNYYINEDGTGNFAPNVTVLNQVSTEQNTLVGVHNLSAANLRHVLKMGGLANPSIGIVDTTKQALEGYGEITLIAPTPLIDKSTGRNAGTYAADIYSPRYPSVDVEITAKAYEEITQRVRDALKKDSVASILSNIEDNAKDLTYSRGLKSLFIAEKYGELEADGYSYIREHNLQQEFEDYARHFLDGYDVKERIFNGYTPSGNRKYITHTLANVSKFMKKQGRQGGEGFNYGLGNFRALLAPKATSTKQIKKWKNRLQDRETFTTIKKELNEEFYRFSEIAGGRYGADAGEERLAEAVRLRRDIPSYLESEYGIYMSDEDANDLRAFVAKLSEMPTEYFETKFERPVMLNEFAGALVPHDLPADLKDVLKENALQVYEYDREGDRTKALADATKDLAQRRKVLFQSVKGSTVFQSNGQRIIQLFEDADESTFLHEMSHIYLDELKQLAEMAPDSDAGKDYATIMAWASYKEGASAEYAGTATASEFAGREAEIRQAMRDGFVERKVDGTTVTVTKDQLLAEWAQERFARGFEAYLQSGEAPASALKKAFRNLKKWLNKIYKAVTGNGKVAAQPSEDVKRIMDRMLASEEQIELAAAEMLLNSTDDEIAERAQAKELQDKLLAEAKAEAEERMLKKLLKQNIKKAKEDYIAKRREELREELYDDNRCYQAELMVENMDEQAAMEICGYDSVDEWKAELADAMGGLEAGVKFYLDGELEQLDESFLNVEQLREQAKQELASTEVMAELINLQKEIYARLELKREQKQRQAVKLRKMRDKARRQAEWLRGIRDALKGKVKVQRQAAREIMSSLPIREATASFTYWRKMETADRAALKAIAKAIRRNNEEEVKKAVYAKEEQGRYIALYRESLKAKATVDKLLRNINKRIKSVKKKDSHVGPEYRYFFDKLMFAYGFIETAPIVPSTLEGVSFKDFIDSQYNELDGDGPTKLSDLIPPEILAAIESDEATDYKQRKNKYKDLTIDQLATVDNVAKIIRHWGINSNSRLTDGKSFDEIAGELYTSAMENCDVKTRDDKVNPIKNTLGGYIADILKPELILNILGGRNGKWVAHIYNILFDATEQKRILKEQTNDQMTKLITACYGKGWNRWKIQRKWKNKIPTAKLTTGAVLTKEQVICMALNWGNADNRKKLCDGFNMAEDSVKAILDRHMEKRDWRFVQGVWNILEGLGDKVSLVTEKEYGLPMQRIKAAPFTVGDMTLAGGYYPIAYRRDGNPRADAKQELEEKKSLTGALALGTGMGQTKSRTSSVPIAPLRLELAVLDKHINQSCHIATMRLACRDAFKTLNQPGVAQAVVDIFGDKVYRMLKQWVTDCWAEPLGTEGIERWAGKLRSNTVSAIMAYRLSTAVLNFANISPTIDVLGAKGTLEALMMFVRHPMRIGEKCRFVLADSAWMRDRANNLDRDLSKVSDNLFTPDNPALHGINKFSSWLLEATDMLTTVPVYYYTYQTTFNEEIERGTEAEEAHRIAHRKAHENVRSIVGSADTVDTAAISRSKNEFVKALTPFYSFANTMGNAVYGKALAGYYKGGKATFAERYGDFVKSFVLRYLLMSLMETGIIAGIYALTAGDGDEDKYRDLNAFLLEWAKNSVSSATGAFYVANLLIEAGMDGILNETSRGRSSISVLGGTWNRFIEARDQTRKFNEGKTDFIDFGRSLTKAAAAGTGFSDTIADSLWNSLRFIEDDYRFDNMNDLREYIAKTLFDRKLKKKG